MTQTLSQQESSATLSSALPSVFSNESYLGDPWNDPERWQPRMRRPFGVDVERFQKLIDRIVGLSHGGHSIIKLEWAPEVYEWRPYALGSNPTGYTLPYWLALWDKDGNEVAAPRWVLHERCEPEQYLPTWENSRWVRLEGKMHDAKGEPPSDGIYTRFHRHIVHQDGCCLRAGNEDNCWGYYIEPNADLLEFIGKKAWEARNDKAVQPTSPIALLSDHKAETETRTKLESQKLNPNNKVRYTPKFKRSPYLWVPEEG